MYTKERHVRIAALCGAALLAVACAYGVCRYAHGSFSFLFYRMTFNYLLARESRELKVEACSGLSNTYYFTSYYTNGILSAAEGTGSSSLLRRAMRVIDTQIAMAQQFESHGRLYYAWPPFSVTPDTTIPKPNLHYTFQAMVPVARAAAIIMTHPEWKKKYGYKARRYIDFADQSIIRYWYHDQLQDRIPWVNPDDFPIWNDNASNLGLVAAFLYQATGDRTCKDIARQVGLAFRAKLSPYKSGWIWENQTIRIGSDTDNTPGSVGNQAGVPDTSHANREAFLMITLYEAGILYTREDIQRMAGTLSDTLWNRSAAAPGFANYLNGSDKPYRVYKEPGLNGSVYHGWVLTGGYSQKAQLIMRCTLTAILKGKHNGSLERNATSYGGTLALCGHILKNFAVMEKNDGNGGGRRDGRNHEQVRM